MASQLDVPMPFAGRTVLLAQMLMDTSDFVPTRYIPKPSPESHLNPCEIQGLLRRKRVTVGITDYDKTSERRRVEGPVHAYVKASPNHLSRAGEALRQAVLCYCAQPAPIFDTGGPLARMLIDQVPPPRPRRLPDVTPGPPAIDADSDAEWERYADEDGRNWWRCNSTGRYFMEGAPGTWSKYVDEGGRLWWWHDDGAWFFADTGCRR